MARLLGAQIDLTFLDKLRSLQSPPDFVFVAKRSLGHEGFVKPGAKVLETKGVVFPEMKQFCFE